MDATRGQYTMPTRLASTRSDLTTTRCIVFNMVACIVGCLSRRYDLYVCAKLWAKIEQDCEIQASYDCVRSKWPRGARDRIFLALGGMHRGRPCLEIIMPLLIKDSAHLPVNRIFSNVELPAVSPVMARSSRQALRIRYSRRSTVETLPLLPPK